MTIAEDRLQQFVEELPLGLIVLDRKNQIQLCNNRALDMVGIAVEDVLVGRFEDVVGRGKLKELMDRLEPGDRDEHHCEIERGGRAIACTIHRTERGESEEAGTVIVLEDITELRRMELVKRDFVNTILQRLRGPLAGLKTSLSLAVSPDLAGIPAGMREVLEMSLGEVNQLNALVADLRNLFMIEIGLAHQEVERETFPARKVLRRAIQHLGRQPAPYAAATERVAIADSPGAAITADFDKTLHVLTILFKNATAFSPPDAPVEVTVTSESAHTSMAIKDRGIGMSEETQQRLFEKFFRADNHITRTLGGNGLGLFIAKSFVEIMGGTIQCESRVGEGSIFTVTLPGGRTQSNEARS